MNYIEASKVIIKTLNNAGFEAYYVGGYVRDYLLGIIPNDIDITTKANPSEICSIFNNCKDKGIDYNSVVVKIDEYSFEVTSYRKDLSYSDHRHPITTLANSLEEDLVRRDFTVNALAMGLDGQIIDLFNGKDDLAKKLIRTIGIPQVRFEEDALRMLRACYFASKLNFSIEKNTLDAIKLKAPLCEFLSEDRIYEEISKIILTKRKNIGVKYLYSTGLYKYMPDFTKSIDYIYNKDDYNFDMLDFLVLSRYLNKQDFKTTIKKSDLKSINNILSFIGNNNYDAIFIFGKTNEEVKHINNISRLLGFSSVDSNCMDLLLSSNEIRSYDDIKLKPKELIKIFGIKEGKWISIVFEELKNQILSGNLLNEEDSIKNYLISKGELKWMK